MKDPSNCLCFIWASLVIVHESYYSGHQVEILAKLRRIHGGARLSFAVHPGEIVGLVGANGAGKTTTLRAITGILRPTAGTVRIGGLGIEKEPVAAKQQFAYIPDTVHPYDLLTVTEHLHFIALAYRVENAETKYAGLLDELELADKKDEPASSLSRGMLQSCRWRVRSCASLASSSSTNR
jgi:ABC-type multidrug transport system ATPase subunit